MKEGIGPRILRSPHANQCTAECVWLDTMGAIEKCFQNFPAARGHLRVITIPAAESLKSRALIRLQASGISLIDRRGVAILVALTTKNWIN
jgi:hypothetical protein